MPVTIPGVTFFENFANNAAGVTVPLGWTLLTGGTPTIEADLNASGLKVLKLPESVGAFAMIYDEVGEDHDHFEILMKVKVSRESQNVSPYSNFGGPGGRMSYAAGRLRAVGMDLTNQGATCFCNANCQGCRPIGRGLPGFPGFTSATGFANSQAIMAIGQSDLDFLQMFGGDIDMASGPPVFVKGACTGGGWNWKCPPAEQQNSYGDVIQWHFHKLRVGPESNRVRVVVWKSTDPEPVEWAYDGQFFGGVWPDGGGLGILQRPAVNRQGVTYVDWISFTLDPVAGQAPIPEAIPTACPMPDGTVGEAYEYDLDSAAELIE